MKLQIIELKKELNGKIRQFKVLKLNNSFGLARRPKSGDDKSKFLGGFTDYTTYRGQLQLIHLKSTLGVANFFASKIKKEQLVELADRLSKDSKWDFEFISEWRILDQEWKDSQLSIIREYQQWFK